MGKGVYHVFLHIGSRSAGQDDSALDRPNLPGEDPSLALLYF